MRLTRLHSRLFSRRGLAIGGSVIAAIVMIAGYIVWSQQVWQQVTPTSAHWHQQIKSDTDKAAVIPVDTPEEKNRAMAAFVALVKQIDETSRTICATHPLVQWQANVVTSLKKELTACRQKAALTQEYKAQLQKVVIYLQNDQALANLIAEVPQPDQLDDAAWGGQVTAWGVTGNLIKVMEVSESFKPVQAQAADQSSKVAAAWQEVVAASQAKDKKRYLAAQDALASAHDGLNEITVTNDEAFRQLTEKLQAAYAQLFTPVV